MYCILCILHKLFVEKTLHFAVETPIVACMLQIKLASVVSLPLKLLWQLQLLPTVLMLTLVLSPVAKLCFFFLLWFYTLSRLQQMLFICIFTWFLSWTLNHGPRKSVVILDKLDRAEKPCFSRLFLPYIVKKFSRFYHIHELCRNNLKWNF